MRRFLTTGNRSFPGLFAPQGVRSANFFLVRRRLPEIPGVFDGFPGNDPEMIAAENRRSVHWPMMLRCDPIDSACGIDIELERIGSSHRPDGPCFVADIASVFEHFGTEAAMIGPRIRSNVHVPLLLRCNSIGAECGHDRASVGTCVLRCMACRSGRRCAQGDGMESETHLYILVQYQIGSSSAAADPGVPGLTFPLRTAAGSSVPDDIACSSASLQAPMLSSARSRFRL